MLTHRKKVGPRPLAGDRNWWHPGIAGVIIRAEFFGAPTVEPETEKVRFWTGSAWNTGKVWTGSAWHTISVWIGSSWRQ